METTGKAKFSLDEGSVTVLPLQRIAAGSSRKERIANK